MTDSSEKIIKKRISIVRWVFACIVFALLSVWLIPTAKIEISTLLHKNEFDGLQTQTGWLDKDMDLKVLDYSDKTASVYYRDDESTDRITFNRDSSASEWHMSNWETLWVKQGSADDFIWPYFYDCPEGLGITVMFGIPAALILFGAYKLTIHLIKKRKTDII